jgi:hypothetical protein
VVITTREVAWSLRLFAARIFLSSSVDVEARIEGMFEHGLYRCPIRAAPEEVPTALTLAHTNAQLDLVMGQIADQSAEGAQLFKFPEDGPHNLLHLFIWVELDLSRGAPDIAELGARLCSSWRSSR